MKYTADCPQCSAEFQVRGPAAAKAGLNCPKCGIQFFPEELHHDNADEVKRLRGAAELIFVIAMISIGASVFIFVLGGDAHIPPEVAAAPFSLGLILILLSQLLHIRAALEKLDRK